MATHPEGVLGIRANSQGALFMRCRAQGYAESAYPWLKLRAPVRGADRSLLTHPDHCSNGRPLKPSSETVDRIEIHATRPGGTACLISILQIQAPRSHWRVRPRRARHAAIDDYVGRRPSCSRRGSESERIPKEVVARDT